jgi:hypothetical protein
MYVFIPRSLCALKRVTAKQEHARFGATTGIRFEVKDGVLRVEATDGRRLVVVQAEEPPLPDWPGLKETPDDALEALVSPADLEKACKACEASTRWQGAGLIGLATVGGAVCLGAGLNGITVPQIDGRFPNTDMVIKSNVKKPLFSFRIDPKLFAETMLALNDLLPAEANSVDIFFYGTGKPIGFCAKNAASDPPLLIEGLFVPLVSEKEANQQVKTAKKEAEANEAKQEPEDLPTDAKDFPVNVSTPTPQHFQDAKARHPNMVLLFRVGDFYELFEADADLAAKALGLTVTTGDGGRAMAGFPHHQLETHLRKLLAEGYRVAICEPGGAEVEQAEPMPEPPVTEEKPKRPRRGKKLAVVSSSDEAV